jgi:hypothetical protein
MGPSESKSQELNPAIFRLRSLFATTPGDPSFYLPLYSSILIILKYPIDIYRWGRMWCYRVWWVILNRKRSDFFIIFSLCRSATLRSLSLTPVAHAL